MLIKYEYVSSRRGEMALLTYVVEADNTKEVRVFKYHSTLANHGTNYENDILKYLLLNYEITSSVMIRLYT